MQPPTTGHSWLGVDAGELPVGAAYDWCVQPECGAVVVFSGTHLHQTLGHFAGHTRFSLDFRLVRVRDHEAGKGPPNHDNRSRGSATRDYVRLSN